MEVSSKKINENKTNHTISIPESSAENSKENLDKKNQKQKYK